MAYHLLLICLHITTAVLTSSTTLTIASHSAGNSEAIQGHNNIATVIAREVRRAGGQAWLEPRFQLPGQIDEHTDIRIALGAELIYVDVSIVHPTCASYLCHSISASLGAARQAEIRKNVQYLERAS